MLLDGLNSKIIQKIVVVMLFLFSTGSASAQPEICTAPVLMTPKCADACIICDIDGFTGTNNGGSVGEAPSGFCTSQVHNARWIAFMAGSENLKLKLSVSNCNSGRGLELAIYEGIDCQNFRMVSNCLGSANAVGDGKSAIFQNTEPLVIGQYYYIVMDGSQADVCNWSFSVLEGSTKVSPLSVTNPIVGDTTKCPKSGGWYYTEKISGAIDYNWTLNGLKVGNGDSIYLDWPKVGTYKLCVKASNACDEADEACITVVVKEIPVTNIDSTLCNGDTLRMGNGALFYTAGKHFLNFVTSEGCDSILAMTLKVLPNSSASFNYNMCVGDSFPWQGYFIKVQGIYSDVHTASNGCDSSTVLNLHAIECELNLEAELTHPKCYKEHNGSIQFKISNGTPPFSYTWASLQSESKGSGNGVGLNENVVLNGLSSAWYTIYVNDNYGIDVAYQFYLRHPDSLSVNNISSEFNGYNISCKGFSDGEITIVPSGGTPSYSFEWEDNDTASFKVGLSAGLYKVNVSDANGCNASSQILLTEPDSLVAKMRFKDPDCFLENSGEIQVTDIIGGVKPFKFTLDGKRESELAFFDGLEEGTYTVTVYDNNGCETDSTANLVSPIIAEVNAYQDLTIFLGDTITLWAESSNTLLSGANTFWTPSNTVLCDTCPSTSAIPTRTGYYLITVVSEDNCYSYDSVYIVVTPRGRVYVPSAFTPNNDGLNETFRVLGGPEILEITSFLIYNRWGEQIFKQENMPPHQSSIGWDGTYKGVDVPQGVYVWVAEVEYLDNRKYTYSGTITLLR